MKVRNIFLKFRFISISDKQSAHFLDVSRVALTGPVRCDSSSACDANGQPSQLALCQHKSERSKQNTRGF